MRLIRIGDRAVVYVSQSEYEYIRYNGFCSACPGCGAHGNSCPMDEPESVMIVIVEEEER